MDQAEYYKSIGYQSPEFYDSINSFHFLGDRSMMRNLQLEKIVFGYHPYWAGSNYLNYRWELLSDMSYFSYDVDPLTGEPSSLYSWLTSPSIDSALANNVRVHLCVTLFSNHSTFFTNPAARQTLTNNLIQLVTDRGAHGVSFDFEAVPPSQGENMQDYIAEFALAFYDNMPDGIISIAMPAVDWNATFDVSILNQYIDLYMIMGYDYYWNGSSQAGPVDPHYSMTSGYDYNVSRTISYYQSEGMPMDKMLIGVPYYAREWPTASGTAPSSTTANGTAYTWAKIKNNTSGNYNHENKRWETNSFAPYYAYEDNGWYQCFVNDENSLERRYKLVNTRNLGGIGIWALGYDDGYSDLWDVIEENLTVSPQITLYDTIYDSGGPSWNYYNDEVYVTTIYGLENEALYLEFTQFDLETGYDSLWIYDGYYPGGELAGAYTGSELPQPVYTFDVMSIRFRSDNNTAAAGWTAIIESFPISVDDTPDIPTSVKLYPNPVQNILNVEFASYSEGKKLIRLYDINGRIMTERSIPPNSLRIKIDVSAFSQGIYLLSPVYDGISAEAIKLIIY